MQTGNHEHRSWIYRRLWLPVLALLRMGVSPERLAWSIAIGCVIGINPLFGSTTVLALAIAAVFRLSIPATQVGNHVVYPLQFILFLPFVRVGSWLFHTAELPLSISQIVGRAKHDLWGLTKELWTWEWHALIVWGICSALLAPLLAVVLTPLLRKLLPTVHQVPTAES